MTAFAERRKEIVAKYDRAFSEMPELKVQREIPESDTVRHLYILRLNPDRLTCDRRQFFDALREKIYTHRCIICRFIWHSYYEKLGL